MEKIHSVEIEAAGRTKELAVFCGDVTLFDEPLDILTTSAYVGSYAPIPGTVFNALDACGISVYELSNRPMLDLRTPCHVWLSQEIGRIGTAIQRIGCIELSGNPEWCADPFEAELAMINSVRAYFYMLDLAAVYGVAMDTVALPLIGGGQQHISGALMLMPLINECVSFLKRNDSVSRICFVEKDPNKAALIAQHLRDSLRFAEGLSPAATEKAWKDLAFISYSSKDKNIADNLCAKLEQRGIKVWYAPRDVQGPYAEAIVEAIEKARYFVVILSQNSIASQHVLNEVDLAFQNISKGMKFKPLRIDNVLFTPSFKYYLSRQHWMDATIPPLEERLNEFVADILNESDHI